MNWAWQQKLSPTPKLILMALADAANDFGVCWPSVSTVATKCCVSVRTVRRVIQKLVERGLLLSEQRYRKDGSCSSNRYRLQLEGGDNLTPAPDSHDITPGQGCEGTPDTGDIPGTTIRTQKESLQPQGTVADAVVFKSAASGSGELFELEYPGALSVAEREEAGKRLAGIPADLAQQLLDELAARIAANVIQTTPLAYLRGLTRVPVQARSHRRAHCRLRSTADGAPKSMPQCSGMTPHAAIIRLPWSIRTIHWSKSCSTSMPVAREET